LLSLYTGSTTRRDGVDTGLTYSSHYEGGTEPARFPWRARPDGHSVAGDAGRGSSYRVTGPSTRPDGHSVAEGAGRGDEQRLGVADGRRRGEGDAGGPGAAIRPRPRTDLTATPQPAGVTERERRDPDALRRRAGVAGDRRQDQHFLVDDRVLDRLPTHLPAGADESRLLEIGAGTGALTDRLLARAAAAGPDAVVTAIERDARLSAFLREEFAPEIDAGRLCVVEGDALEVDLPAFSACVSNLPYGISSEVLFRLLPAGTPLVVTVQREFAERMAADPGADEYGRLSVTAGHYADATVVETVPPEAFDPRPRVESAVVRAVPRTPDYEVPDDDFFLSFVTACFTQRRKTMRNAVRNTAHISGLSDAGAVVERADEELMGRRAGRVTPAEFAELATLAWEVGR